MDGKKNNCTEFLPLLVACCWKGSLETDDDRDDTKMNFSSTKLPPENFTNKKRY